jgi:hypothetical protein
MINSMQRRRGKGWGFKEGAKKRQSEPNQTEGVELGVLDRNKSHRSFIRRAARIHFANISNPTDQGERTGGSSGQLDGTFFMVTLFLFVLVSLDDSFGSSRNPFVPFGTPSRISHEKLQRVIANCDFFHDGFRFFVDTIQYRETFANLEVWKNARAGDVHSFVDLQEKGRRSKWKKMKGEGRRGK